MSDVWITGIGIVSALGNSVREMMCRASPPDIDWDTFDPYGACLVNQFDPSEYVPKRSEQRAMSDMMLYAVDAAGQALKDAHALGKGDLLDRMGLFVGAGMSARDSEADAQILTIPPHGDARWSVHNAMLQQKLRPTLFLAQLPNLVAGNISISLGVRGMSRTLMGEEMAGSECLRLAHRQVSNGLRNMMLVGGCFSANRPEVVASYASAGLLRRKEDKLEEGIVLGSGAAFVVMENADHAAGRGVRPYLKICGAQTDRIDRLKTKTGERAFLQWKEIGATHATRVALIGGGDYTKDLNDQRQVFFDALRAAGVIELVQISTGEMFGHLIDASPIASLVLASILMRGGHLASIRDTTHRTAPPRQAICFEWGHSYGESLIVVESA